MANRRRAYLGALKFHFQNGLVSEGWDTRKAWIIAKQRAAEYAFQASSRHLSTVSLPVW
jgi:hypothetical protein